MKSIIFCEGTTDLLMLQFVLQYRYGWTYHGFLENNVTNRLLHRKLIKGTSSVEIQSCAGITNIPLHLADVQERMRYLTRDDEKVDKVIVMIDHDTITSNEEFVQSINEKLCTDFSEECINSEIEWNINNTVKGDLTVRLHIHSLPEEETGAIENVIMEALSTDNLEDQLILDCKEFIRQESERQDRYLKIASRIPKAVINTYFAIRIPEEKYDERARILKAFQWKDNEVINHAFGFLESIAL